MNTEKAADHVQQARTLINEGLEHLNQAGQEVRGALEQQIRESHQSVMRQWDILGRLQKRLESKTARAGGGT